MGVIKYIITKLLSIFLFALALILFIAFGSKTIWILIVLVIFIAGVYFWKHNPFN